jgi:HlyD family secretion protein
MSRGLRIGLFIAAVAGLTALVTASTRDPIMRMLGNSGRAATTVAVDASQRTRGYSGPPEIPGAETRTPKGQARRPLAPAVTVVKARERDFVDRLFVSGTLVPRDEAMVGAEIDGLRIVELLAEDGDRVAKGQVLARLDRPQLDALAAQNDAALVRAEAAIGQARSQIDQFDAIRVQAAADLARARKLEVGIITQATLDQRIAAARSAEAQLAAAKSALTVAEAERASREAERRELMVRIARVDVKAPVAGIISRRTARLGAVAMGAGDPLFRIITDGAIELEAEVPEDWLARLTPGIAATIELPGVDRRVDGKVRLILSEVEKASRLGKVRIELPPEAPARIGSFATGSIEIARRLSVGVPTSAVIRTNSGDSVQVVKNGHIELRAVIAGVTNRGFAEAREGLADGELVIARAAAFLRPGDEVRFTEVADAVGQAAQ